MSKNTSVEKPTSLSSNCNDHQIQVGGLAPSFTALTDENQTLSLQQCQGRWVVLYFYPKDNTPGCTKEAQDFTQALNQLIAKDALVLGISRDSVASHARFKAKHAISYALLADTDETICQRYGVIKNKIMYGKRVRGIERSTFLIDRQGILRRIWRGVKVPGHVDEVLKTLEQLT